MMSKDVNLRKTKGSNYKFKKNIAEYPPYRIMPGRVFCSQGGVCACTPSFAKKYKTLLCFVIRFIVGTGIKWYMLYITV